ncbi:7-deoxyloganetic acid glucosyl transferase-like [Malania oleifera]|uniref:7-deoxyloganetic acid glucosyl transferase-like n=1 Tax=Malania oleifera TaxID=397392 RepID=UPI0025AE11ED|nr:7-deoxyloganetic acid glucosyl transferase-like [Malania oleifera]
MENNVHQSPLPLPPHVLIFPFPVQGHVNSMLKLAELLSLAGIHITFLNSPENHRRLLRHADAEARFGRYPGFRFETLPAGVSDVFPGNGDNLKEMFDSLKAAARPLLMELIVTSRVGGRPPITCIVADGIYGFAIDVAREVGARIIFFRTVSACCLWSYMCIPNLIKAGDLPFIGNDMDRPVTSIPGMEGFMRWRDLPSFMRDGDIEAPGFQLVMTESLRTPEADALILNTFEDLEGPILSHLRISTPNIYTVGPLHAHLKSKLAPKDTPSLSSPPSNSFWEEDRSCMTWLDAQPSKSVIYVSFGSIAVVTRDELIEIWYGLVNSGQRFLWVVRPDSVAGPDGEERQVPPELLEGTQERGYMVGWAPQDEVLGHAAVGGFLTHSGWNSTLESLVVGVPMICWSYFADQQVNSRFVSEVWKLGLDMKDTCDRVIVDKLVRDLMEVRRDEFVRSADEMARLARSCLAEGGSSYCNLNRLIEDLRLTATGSSSFVNFFKLLSAGEKERERREKPNKKQSRASLVIPHFTESQKE